MYACKWNLTWKQHYDLIIMSNSELCQPKHSATCTVAFRHYAVLSGRNFLLRHVNEHSLTGCEGSRKGRVIERYMSCTVSRHTVICTPGQLKYKCKWAVLAWQTHSITSVIKPLGFISFAMVLDRMCPRSPETSVLQMYDISVLRWSSVWLNEINVLQMHPNIKEFFLGCY